MSHEAAKTHDVATVDHDPFAAGAVSRVVPSTEPQREIWLASQLSRAASLAYNESNSFRFRGPLNTAALHASLKDLMQRYDAWRGTFAPDGQTFCIAEAMTLAMPVRDLTNKPATAQARELTQAIQSAVTTPFSLLSGPLLHAELLKLAAEDHQLIITAHHVICDGWSWGIAKRELAQAYTARANGRVPQFAAAPAAFGNYATETASYLHSAQHRGDEAYWLARFADDVPPLDLPLDHARPTQRTFAAARVDHIIGASLVADIQRLGTRESAGLFATLLGAYAALLCRLSGQSEVVVGIATASQSIDDNAAVVGHAVNMLPLRLGVSPDDTIATLIKQTQSQLFDALEHQRYTYGTLLKRLRVPRDPGRLPLVSAIFNLEQATKNEQLQFPGLEVDVTGNPRVAENFELFVNAVLDAGQLRLEAQYKTDLFSHETVQRWLNCFEMLLAAAVRSQRETRIADINLTSVADHALLQQWNATTAAFAATARLGDLLRQQVAKSPTAQAVLYESKSLSYAELDAAAQSLALRLRAHGVGPGSRVGVCLDRSVELVTTLVAIVYSGGAYVPLDPSHPPNRLAAMCADANVAVIVSRSGEWQSLGLTVPAATQVLLLDQAAADDVPAAATYLNFPLQGTASDPLYVIFTSGSTGRPKGAINTHAGVVNWLRWMQHIYPLVPADRVMQKTPYSFDVSVREFFWPLISGACIVVARPEGHLDNHYLMSLIQSSGVTLIHFVPSLLPSFLATPGVEQCRSLRMAMCSGEALTRRVVDEFHSRLPAVRLINLYGPTETAIEVTHWECLVNDERPNIPLGRPIANTQMHVLDPALRPLPIGIYGDLYIAGVPVGLGYVARPELTAERFISDPTTGARMFKTGDSARWTAERVIEFLGRTDQQVKIRGNRIELGEIEAVLAAHSGVSRCLVVTHEEPGNDTALVAYIVPTAAMPHSTALRDHLRLSLPQYMLPKYFVALPDIPLLSNGKLNRRALPAPTEETASAAPEFVEPASAAEIAIAGVWKQLLGIERVSVTDNFFDLGGHSLLAMSAVTEIEKATGNRLSVDRMIFETLGQIAANAPGAKKARKSGWLGRLFDG